MQGKKIAFRAIRHFHISHNAPYLPPKILHKYCLIFSFSWDGCNTQHKRKTKVMQNFFRGKQGELWEVGSGIDYIFLKTASLLSSDYARFPLCMPSLLYEFLLRERSIRSLLYHLNKDAQQLMHFVHGQRITPMIQTLRPFIPGINWESQYLGQVTRRYLLPISHLRPRSYVEALGQKGASPNPITRFDGRRPSFLYTNTLKACAIVACENSRFSSLFAALDVSRGGTSATQRQKFHTDDVKSVQNPVISADWTTEQLHCFSYCLRMTSKDKRPQRSNLNAMNL